MIAYFDTSAIVPLVVDEATTETCQRLWTESTRPIRSAELSAYVVDSQLLICVRVLRYRPVLASVLFGKGPRSASRGDPSLGIN